MRSNKRIEIEVRCPNLFPSLDLDVGNSKGEVCTKHDTNIFQQIVSNQSAPKHDIPKIPAKNTPKHPPPITQGPQILLLVRSMLERFEKRFESQEVFDVVLVLGGTNDVLQNVPWPMMAMEPNANTLFQLQSNCTYVIHMQKENKNKCFFSTKLLKF